jgi:single-stranded-DNA-specific exonuclease
MTRPWLEPPPISVPPDLAAVVGGHPLVAETLVRRGITTPAAARAFLDGRAYTPTPPEALPGLTVAVERLEAAIRAGEPICVWGDFDVDGQTATTLLVSALADLGARVTYHIPVRATEGHGVGLGPLAGVIAAGARVILTCDTGIAAVEAAAFARSQGVDFIITDHHDLPAVLPDAYAVVNPKVQEAGDRSQEAGDGSQEAGDRSQEAGDRSQEAGDRSQEAGSESALNGGEVAQDWGEVALNRGEIAQDWGEVALNRGEVSQDGGEVVLNRGEIAQDGGEVAQDRGRVPQNREASAPSGATSDEQPVGWIGGFSRSGGRRANPAEASNPVSDLRSLPGVGVAYKLAEALYRRAGRAEAAEGLLDLVALGIVADLAELAGDVRPLLQRGLAALRETRRLGLRALMETAELDPARLGEEHISFVIAPRLNAVGRLDDANVAVEFLMLGTGVARSEIARPAVPGAGHSGMGRAETGHSELTRARILAADLEALNARRKLLCDQVDAAAEAQLKRDPALLEQGALVLAGPGWHPGVVGIVASRLVERYGKPVVLISLPAAGSADPARGSARSVAGVNITAAIAAHADLLLGFGGHPMAAGLSLPTAHVAEFRRGLSRTVAKLATAAGVVSGLPIDGALSLSDLSLDFVADLERLAPFGPGNPPLTLVSRDLRVRGKRTIGRDQSHLLVIVEDAWGAAQEVIWWDAAGETPPDGKFDLAYTVRANDYRGVRGVQATWLAARPAAGAEVEVKVKAEVEVVDCRGVADPLAALQQIPAEALIWCEDANDAPNALRTTQYATRNTHHLANRRHLTPASHLVIWTAPPGPVELRLALAAVRPEIVTLFGRDPGLDAPAAFLRRLSGLVKHALSRNGGLVRVAELAAALAAREATVRQGLAWLAGRGHIRLAAQPSDPAARPFDAAQGAGDELIVEPGDGVVRPELAGAAARLEALLAETAAYRRHFVTADKDRLLR